MQQLRRFCHALGVLASVSLLTLLALALLLAGCNREAYQGARLSPAADSVVRATLPSARKYKLSGPVNITIQQGRGNVANPVATGKAKADAAAIGASPTASATRPTQPWVTYGLLLAGGLTLGGWAGRRFFPV
ncbi:hypothetical protein [Hymenobacter rubidus]|uniref:hypothetical protein n=1 Tax=Hymenobacter rubidus TaxID=1441626 RepID=UPI00191F3373|nr:hypothetical protein [Hymenobacter rubidus]